MMIPDHLIRQSDKVPLAILETKITVIGAGAIGSFVALTLAKMGFADIAVYDFDTVDTVNLSSQFYRHSDIGKPKVEALQSLIEDFTGIKIQAINERFEAQRLSGIVVTAVDSMAARKLVFDNLRAQTFAVPLVLDPRMSIETAHVYSYRPMAVQDCETYSNSLFSDENSVQERCTGKATMYTALMLSGITARCVRDFLTERKAPKSILWDISKDDLISHSRTC